MIFFMNDFNAFNMSFETLKNIRENKSDKDKLCYELQYYNKNNYKSFIHKSSFVSCLCPLASINIETDGKTLACNAGNILLFHEPATFSIENIKTDDGVFVLNLKKDFFDTIFISQIVDCPIFYDFVRLPENEKSSSQYLFFDCSFFSPVGMIAQVLFHQSSYTEIKDIKSVRSACTLFFTELHRCHQKTLLVCESSMMPQYEAGRFLKYMADNYRYVTLEIAARHFGYNTSYFSVLFKKLENTTFSKKLQEIRIEQAKRFLLTTSLSVEEIIELVGFSEKSYFHKTFKLLVGLTPGEYRKIR
ncbi:MAG: helix-turn-helix transcriptional regulator [Treponema sp.]|nr:helix-turn-helix transcriptional regulator [Treponema sp.]